MMRLELTGRTPQLQRSALEFAQVTTNPPRSASSRARSFTDAMYLAFGGNAVADLSALIQKIIADSRGKRFLELLERSEFAKNVGKWEFNFPIHPLNGIGHLNNLSEYTLQLKLKVSSLGGTLRELKSLASLMPIQDLNQVMALLERMNATGRSQGGTSAKIANNIDLRLMFHPPNNLRAAVFLVRELPLSGKADGTSPKPNGVVFYSARAGVTNVDATKPGAQAPFRTSVGVELDLPLGKKGNWMGLGMIRASVYDSASSAGLVRQGDKIGQIVEVNGRDRFLHIPNGGLMASAFGGATKVPVTNAPVIPAAEFFADRTKLSPKAKADVMRAQQQLKMLAPVFDQTGSALHLAAALASREPVFIATALIEASQKGHDDFYAEFRQSNVYSSASAMSQTIRAIYAAWAAPRAGQSGNRHADMRSYVVGALGDAFSRAISDGHTGLYSAYGVAKGLMNSQHADVRSFGVNLVRGTVVIPFSNAVVGMNVRTDPRLQFLDRLTGVINSLSPRGKAYFGPDRIPNQPQDVTNALNALKSDSPRNFKAALEKLANRERIDFGVPELKEANEALRRRGPLWQGPRGSVEPIDVQRHVHMIEGRR
jgi:hypothetical protein